MRPSRVSAALGAAAASLLLAVTGVAQATQSAPPAKPYGTVTASPGVNARQYLSTDSSVRAVLKHHQKVGLDCKVRAQSVEGNTVWYKLRVSERWVPARYVANTGNVPLCKDKHPAKLSQKEKKQSGQAKG